MSIRSTSPRIHVQRKSKPESFPVTLEEVKSFLRIENDQDDQLISSFIFMATDYAEWHMEKSLVKQTWQVSYEDYVPHRIYLSYGPVNKIILATAKNQKLRYYFSNVGSYIELFNYLNVTRADIVYEAGYDSVPEQIKLGIMQHVSALYKNRESEINRHLSEIKEGVFSIPRTKGCFVASSCYSRTEHCKCNNASSSHCASFMTVSSQCPDTGI